MIRILFISHGTLKGDVRLLKISRFLFNKGFQLSFLGWDRSGNEPTEDSNFINIEYVLKYMSNNKIQLFFSYFLFVFKTTLKLNNRIKKEKRENTETVIYYAINFLGGLSIYFNSLFHPDLIYIYDIYDEFSKSYRFPFFIKKIINRLDYKVRKRAIKIIHVEENRVDSKDKNYIIIRNTPFDFYKNDYVEEEKEKTFAITGWLNKTRGMESIYLFARDNSDFKFIIAGQFKDKNIENKFKSLNNVEIYDFMEQDKLFNLIKKCRGIFSLYDPTIEINRLAASNKLYDAMMLGIPVIVNKEIEAAQFVKKHNIGFIVDYFYNNTWDILTNNDVNMINKLGSNGRKLYSKEYEFNSQVEKVFMPILDKIIEKVSNDIIYK